MSLAISHGHELLCLANLLPLATSSDELDSHMYQTVGHQMVGAYAECMGLPLYRRRIVGSTRSHSLQYKKTEGDEVEDLYALLAYVKAMVPGIEAVSSGAIASDYQRLRVEEVCSRLGLVSLAYMWHQPQRQLLRSMIESGIHAILVKVAALGLDPHKHLGKSLGALEPYLQSLEDRFGCNVCGEGGEYESLVLDCPLFTQGRIVLDRSRILVCEASSSDGVGHLDPVEFHVELKAQAQPQEGSLGVNQGQVHEVPLDWIPPPLNAANAPAPSPSLQFEIKLRVRRGVDFTQIAATPTIEALLVTPEDTAAAIHQTMTLIQQYLTDLSPPINLDSQGVFVHLYLSNMSHFATANAAYCRHFPSQNPPSRACVQASLPPGCPVMIDILLAASDSPAEPRKVLHVQSISSWAPSCIGPYSQANVYKGLIHMAGQIPLDPPTMAIISPLDGSISELSRQTRRALESCEAVAVGLRSSVLQASLGITVFVTPSTDQKMLRTDVVKVIHSAIFASEESDMEIRDSYLAEPVISDHETLTIPQVIVITVDSLPRGSLVEIQPVVIDLAYFQSQRQHEEADEEGEVKQFLGLGGWKMEPRESCQSLPYEDLCLWSRCSYLSRGAAKLSRYLFHFSKDQAAAMMTHGGMEQLMFSVDEIVKDTIKLNGRFLVAIASAGIERLMVRAMAWHTLGEIHSTSPPPQAQDALSAVITTWLPVRAITSTEYEEESFSLQECCVLVEVILTC